MSKDERALERLWWYEQHVPLGQTLECRIGPSTLEVHHGKGEWHLAVTGGEETDDTPVDLTLRQGGIRAEHYDRFMVARPDDRLALVPLLCDRPVVIRPRQPVFLPGGEAVTLYVSTPATLRVSVVGEAPILLREVPTVTLSDTWFGPSTREGELCYAGRTHARHALVEVPRRPHRIITPVRIRNEADSPLPLEKLSLPVPALSVFGGRDGSLWTQGVSLVRSGTSDMAALKVDETPPAYAGGMTPVSGPREPQAHGRLVRAFSVLFGQRL